MAQRNPGGGPFQESLKNFHLSNLSLRLKLKAKPPKGKLCEEDSTPKRNPWASNDRKLLAIDQGMSVLFQAIPISARDFLAAKLGVISMIVIRSS